MDICAVSDGFQHFCMLSSSHGATSRPCLLPGGSQVSYFCLKARQIRKLGSCSLSASSCVGSTLPSRCDAALADTCSTQQNELSNIDWDNIGFGFIRTDNMYVMKCCHGETFSEGHIEPFRDIELSPSAGVLNYGQGIIEGLKAYRKRDGTLVLFRPKEYALRMIAGAKRLCMPAPTVENFIDAIKATVMANKRWVPPCGKGFLYVRPLLIGSGAVLGLEPSTEYTFLIYAAPVGNYFKGPIETINVKVETEMHRGTRGGVGGVKAIGNYAAVLEVQTTARANGFSDVLYLDSARNRLLDEMSSSNIFVIKLSQKMIFTPQLGGTILPGVMRQSVIDIARSLGYTVHECDVPVDELLKVDEVFCTGTAAGVWPVGCINFCGVKVFFGLRMTGGKKIGIGKATKRIHKALDGLLMGDVEDTDNWIMELE